MIPHYLVPRFNRVPMHFRKLHFSSKFQRFSKYQVFLIKYFIHQLFFIDSLHLIVFTYQIQFKDYMINGTLSFRSIYLVQQYPTLRDRLVCLAQCNINSKCSYVIFDLLNGCFLFNNRIL